MSDRLINVLIVDDDEAITWTLSTALRKRDPNVRIFQATTGLEALACIQQLKNLDLLITDIHMPKLSGIELLEKIQERTSLTRIIVITGFGSPEIFNRVEELGAVKYFSKPFDVNAVIDVAIDLIQTKLHQIEAPGFTGSLGRLALVDIIQINGLLKKTGLLTVAAGPRSGKVYFQNGDIVHAESRNVSGEEAVYLMMSWEGGDFSFKEQVQPMEETIGSSWEFILMEHCRRLDRQKIRKPD